MIFFSITTIFICQFILYNFFYYRFWTSSHVSCMNCSVHTPLTNCGCSAPTKYCGDHHHQHQHQHRHRCSTRCRRPNLTVLNTIQHQHISWYLPLYERNICKKNITVTFAFVSFLTRNELMLLSYVNMEQGYAHVHRDW